MKPPKKVQVGPYRLDILVNQILLDVVNAATGDGVTGVGRCDIEQGRLIISPKLGPDAMAETVLHEIVHAINYASGLNDELGADVEEKVTRMIATPLLDVLRRNPGLVRYLTT